MKQISLGGLSFAELRERDKYYVDKTMLIADILSKGDGDVYLFTRPRRFGKTLNLSMLDAFFNMQYEGNTWFDGLAISEHPEYERYKNAFPVIHLNLNDTKAPDYETFIDMMRTAVRNAYAPHKYLLDDPDTDPDFVDLFKSINRRDVKETFLTTSLEDLSNAIFASIGKKPIILIDEYDCAVSDHFGQESHRRILDFLGRFLRSALKTNPNRQMVYMTGVMQIAKESIFSDLNNVTVNNIFSVDSDERFGFTEDEVRDILEYYGHPEKLDEVREWYDGYRFGNVDVYNPFSIMNYIRGGFEPDTYWANSGGDGIVRNLLNRINNRNLSTITDLVTGNVARVKLAESLVFKDVYASDESLFSLMATTGYLNAVPMGNRMFDISIPNKEIMSIVQDMADTLRPVTDEGFLEFNQAVLEGDAERIASLLEEFLMTTSYLNLTDKTPENPYEMMVVTLLIGLCERYTVRTEREMGYGRSDIIMVPKAQGDLGIIMELKIARKDEGLDTGVDLALKQIHDKKYYKEMSGEVLLIGVCFLGKQAKARSEIIRVRRDRLRTALGRYSSEWRRSPWEPPRDCREYCNGMEGRVIPMGMAFRKQVLGITIDSVMNGGGFAVSDAKAGGIRDIPQSVADRRCPMIQRNPLEGRECGWFHMIIHAMTLKASKYLRPNRPDHVEAHRMQRGRSPVRQHEGVPPAEASMGGSRFR